MKILYITNGYKPHRWAGTETYTAALAEEMAKKGNVVEVLCAGNWDQGDKYWMGVTQDVQNGISVRRLNFNWAKSPDPFRYLYDNPVVAEYLKNLLREIKPDLVHVTSCEILSASVLKVVKEAGLPLILTLTDFWFLCPRINLLHPDGHNCTGQTTPAECLDCKMRDNRAYRLAKNIVPKALLYPVMESVSNNPELTRVRGLRGLAGNMAERKFVLKHALTLPDFVVTASNFVREVYQSNETEVLINVKPYGNDLSWLESYSGKSESNVIRFGFTGQIFRAKGVHVLLEAMKEMPATMMDKFSLIIYGNMAMDPVYGRRIQDLASGFPNVSVGGSYPHSESARTFTDMDVLIVPSIWYDFPLVIQEAFATQTPVIAANLGGMAEAVKHEKSGLLFERGNAKDLAKQMQRLINEPELLKQLRRGTPEVRTVQDHAVKFEMIYKQVMHNN